MTYLHLFHGRTDPNAGLDSWGEDGPVLGPLYFVHVVYGTRVHIGTAPTMGDGDLIIREDGLVYYDGVFYGDFSVFGEEAYSADRATGMLSEAVAFDRRKAEAS